MKKLHLGLLAAVFGWAVMGNAHAVALKTLIDNNQSMTVGDKKFSEFWWDSSVSNSSFAGYNFDTLLNSIDVVSLGDNSGLSFASNALTVTSGTEFNWIQLFFGFKVNAIPSNVKLIENSLSLSASVENSGDNGAVIYENTGTTKGTVAGFWPVSDLGTEMEARRDYLAGSGVTDILQDTNSFAPTSAIYVSKAIMVWSESYDTSLVTASLNNFEQRFAQLTMQEPDPNNVPIPGVAALFAIGALGLFIGKGRRTSYY